MKVYILAFVFIFAPAVSAQVRTVKVTAETADTNRLALALEARLKATTRYSVVSHESNSHLSIDVMCLRLTNMNNEDQHVSACRYDFFLNSPHTEWIDGGLMITPDSEISGHAETIFQKFVNNTTEEAVKTLEFTWRAAVGVFCSAPENSVPCGIAKKQ